MVLFVGCLEPRGELAGMLRMQDTDREIRLLGRVKVPVLLSSLPYNVCLLMTVNQSELFTLQCQGELASRRLKIELHNLNNQCL